MVDCFDFFEVVSLGQQIVIVFEQFIVKIGMQIVGEYWDVELIDYVVDLLYLCFGQELCFVDEYVVQCIVCFDVVFYYCQQIFFVVEMMCVGFQFDV